MKKNINANNYEYVDLGLPSGTLWSTCNVGAKTPSDTGLFFQFGDVKGWTEDQIGKDKQFSQNDYKYTKEGDILDLEDDAAHAYMKGDWHMPSPLQIQELLDNTISTWTTLNGVNGRLFTSKSDPSKSIFFPATGSVWNGSVHFSGNNSGIWSNMLNVENTKNGQLRYIYKGCPFLTSSYRCNGFQVRGVISK